MKMTTMRRRELSMSSSLLVAAVTQTGTAIAGNVAILVLK